MDGSPTGSAHLSNPSKTRCMDGSPPGSAPPLRLMPAATIATCKPSLTLMNGLTRGVCLSRLCFFNQPRFLAKLCMTQPNKTCSSYTGTGTSFCQQDKRYTRTINAYRPYPSIDGGRNIEVAHGVHPLPHPTRITTNTPRAGIGCSTTPASCSHCSS